MNITKIYNCQKERLIRSVIKFIWSHKNIKKFVVKRMPYLFSSLYYYRSYLRFPNLRNPKDFNEKMLKLKITDYRTNQFFADCADKYLVREIVKSKGYGSLLNELIAVYENPNEIDFNKLPSQFVLKMNHGSGYNIICKNKDDFDVLRAKKLLKEWAKEDYGLYNGEWHYSNIKPRIIIESYIEALSKEEMLIDYKFNCFDGKVHSIFVCYDRTDNSVNFDCYTPYWERLEVLKPENHKTQRLLPKPDHLQEMVKHLNILINSD